MVVPERWGRAPAAEDGRVVVWCGLGVVCGRSGLEMAEGCDELALACLVDELAVALALLETFLLFGLLWSGGEFLVDVLDWTCVLLEEFLLLELVFALLETFLPVELPWLGFVYLVDELAVALALLETFLLFGLLWSGGEFLVDELDWTCVLLEEFLLLELLRLGFACLVDELVLAFALPEVFLLFVLLWLGFVYLLDGLTLELALLETFLLPVLLRLGFGFLVGKQCFMYVLLEVSGWCGWSSSAWYMDGARGAGDLPGRAAGACLGCCGGAFCTHTLPPGPFFPLLGCPPGVRAPWRGGGAGVGLAPCVGLGDGLVVQVRGVVPVLAPRRRPSLPCSTLASLGEPFPPLAPPLRFEGRFDAPLVA